MAQHDYVIDNQTAPAFRTDLNNALSAIVTLNGGGTAPTTTYGNMIWYNSSSNILYMRNEADDAWIALGTLDQVANTFAPANAVPAGAISYLARSSAPDGWLKANGAAVSRSTYSTLFSAIGTTWGAGDGSTTFNVPDLRGEFLRGWDDSRGVDSGRSFASFQDQSTQNHLHSMPVAFDGNGDILIPGQNAFGNGAAFTTSRLNGSVVSRVEVRNYAVTSGVEATSGETRPRNRALLACIKF
jgi:phage-related tail fiber protein